MKDQFRIRENSWMAGLAARKLGVSAVALTIGNTIHLHRTSEQDFLSNKRWVRHELEHVKQFRRHGFWTFIFLYLAESLKNGYYMNKYELEAREAEEQLAASNKSADQFVIWFPGSKSNRQN